MLQWAVVFLAWASFQASNNPSFTPQWQPVHIGAGGQITAVYNYPDGTTLARSDNYGGWDYVASGSCVYGATVYTAPCWKQLITATSIPNWSIDLSDAGGATELVAAPSNTNVLYLIYESALYVSTNKGTTWVKCSNFLGTTQGANNGNSSGPFIAVDPNNPDILFVDALGHGLYRSTNGTSGASATFAQVATVGTTTEHVIAFQPGSSTHLVVWTKSTGGFESTDGITFSAITTGSPPSSTIANPHIVADQFNQLWVWDAGNSSANVYRWASSSWSAIATGSTGNGRVASFAVDPNSASVGANHIATGDYNGQLNISSNNGATWTGNFSNQTVSAGVTQPAWLANANQNQGSGPYLLNSYSITFDQSSNVILAGGLGLWQQNTPVTANNSVWNANTLGIEQLVSVQLISPSGYAPIIGVWDKGFFTLKNPDVFPSNYWDSALAKNPIVGGWGIDAASADPTFITVFGMNNNGASPISASSTDGGNTWTLWGAQPPNAGIVGGFVAALDSQHWIVAPTNQQLQVTINGGGSWANATVPGSPTNWGGSFGVSNGLAADRVASGTYCTITATQTVYYSTDSGVTFAASGITSANLDGSPNAYTLRSVPGQSGNFFYTPGEQPGSAGNHPANTHLWKLTRATNPCDTATNVNANLKEIISFGFGAHKPGAAGSYPTIYANGWLNGVQGIYYNTDGATTTTWTAINVPASQTPWPLNQADFPNGTEGDPDIYGRVYTIFNQSGASYIDTADACPWISFTNTAPNAALTGTVTLTAQHSGLVPVTGVNFYVDGTQIGTTQTGQTSYSVSFNASGQSPGAHTLKVQAQGNGCAFGGTGNSKSIPITTS